MNTFSSSWLPHTSNDSSSSLILTTSFFRLCLSRTTRLPGTGLRLPLHLPWQVLVEEIFLVLVQPSLLGIFYFSVLFKHFFSGKTTHQVN